MGFLNVGIKIFRLEENVTYETALSDNTSNMWSAQDGQKNFKREETEWHIKDSKWPFYLYFFKKKLS